MSTRSIAVGASLAAVIAIAACASSGGTGGSGGSARPATVRGDRNVISEVELSDPGLRDLTVLEVVRRLRPTYLSWRGPQTLADSAAITARLDRLESGKVHASFDGISIVGVDELSNILAKSVTEIRYLTPSAAMQLFGTRAYAGPVILAVSR